MTWLPRRGTPIIGQGLTGAEGTTGLLSMLPYGTHIVAGVTPKKGGQTHHGIPIFNTVAEALAYAPQAAACIQFVPPAHALSASTEVISARIPLLVIGAEKVPTRDAAQIVAAARESATRIIGPASVGVIGTHEGIKLGFIGGKTPDRAFKKGSVAIVSKSGGMASEIGITLQRHGLGTSWAFGTGGERIIGSEFADIIEELENDAHTEVSVVFGELGGTAEDRLALAVQSGRIRKPVVAYIVGEYASTLPHGTQFGHAGAILESTESNTESKKRRLRDAGVTVVDDFDTLGTQILERIQTP